MTVISLTDASGDTVTTIIVFAANEYSFEQQMGHNICAPFDQGLQIGANSGPNKTCPGRGGSCTFCGKAIPTLITPSNKGSIISEILKHTFERLGRLNLYPRAPKLTPFTLFNVHNSCLQVPLLSYINNLSHK